MKMHSTIQPTPSGHPPRRRSPFGGGSVSAQAEPGPGDARSVRLRWIARAVVVAIGLWFIAAGLRGMWPELGTVAQVLIVVAVVLVVAFAVLGLRYLARRRRAG
jgi:hypothetical protein